MQVVSSLFKWLLHYIEAFSILKYVIHACNMSLVCLQHHPKVVNYQIARHATLTQQFLLVKFQRKNLVANKVFVLLVKITIWVCRGGLLALLDLPTLKNVSEWTFSNALAFLVFVSESDRFPLFDETQLAATELRWVAASCVQIRCWNFNLLRESRFQCAIIVHVSFCSGPGARRPILTHVFLLTACLLFLFILLFTFKCPAAVVGINEEGLNRTKNEF